MIAGLVLVAVGLLAADRIQDLHALAAVALQAETHHVQGIDVEADTVWVSSVDASSKRGFLFVFDRKSGKLNRSVEVQNGALFHPGGLSREGGSIWMPVAEYRRSSSATIQKRDARTLALQFEFPVQDHIGAIAVAKQELIGANWDAREFFVWTKQGREVRRFANPTGLAIQDMKYLDGQLIAGGLRKDGTGAVLWLEWPSLKVLRTLEAGKTDRGVLHTHEGMAIRGRTLFLLPEDGPSRLFSFSLR